MRQMEISRKYAELFKGTQSAIIYYVTVDDLIDSASGIALETYGVGITISESGETQIVRNITFSQSRILALADLLAAHLVTPVTVADIVNDWIIAS